MVGLDDFHIDMTWMMVIDCTYRGNLSPLDITKHPEEQGQNENNAAFFLKHDLLKNGGAVPSRMVNLRGKPLMLVYTALVTGFVVDQCVSTMSL